MADQVARDDIFVYTGGRAPQHVVNAIIDESVDKIDDNAFFNNKNLKSVVCHDGELEIGKWAFGFCLSLQSIKMSGVKIIEQSAFYECYSLTHVELDKLETVGHSAFTSCTSLKQLKLPKIKTVGEDAFSKSGVHEAEFGEDLETIGSGAFNSVPLRRIAIPLKDEMFQLNDWSGTYTQFFECFILAKVDLVGGIHNTVASLPFESWRNEMNDEIQRIHQILPGTTQCRNSKANVIRQWIRSVIRKIDHYKAEHRAILKEATTSLELALWDAKLENGKEDKHSLEEPTAAKKAKIDVEGSRKDARITSGADIVIKNVLSFLMLVE